METASFDKTFGKFTKPAQAYSGVRLLRVYGGKGYRWMPEDQKSRFKLVNWVKRFQGSVYIQVNTGGNEVQVTPNLKVSFQAPSKQIEVHYNPRTNHWNLNGPHCKHHKGLVLVTKPSWKTKLRVYPGYN